MSAGPERHFLRECSDSFLALRKTPLQHDGFVEQAATSRFRERLARHAEKSAAIQTSFGGTWQRVFGDAWRRYPGTEDRLCDVRCDRPGHCNDNDAGRSTASAETILSRAEKFESQHRPDLSHLAQDVLQVEAIDEKTGLASGQAQSF